MDSNTVQIARWRRYGQDRLYVTLADKTKAGYWDLVTDEPHAESPDHVTAIVSAVADWKDQRSSAAQRSELVEDVRVPQPPAAVAAEIPIAPGALSEGQVTEEAAMRPWLDLATNRAGELARVQALAARDAAPVRSLLARALGVHTDERAWRIGADGEEKVAAQLAKASKKDPRWRFIHAVPVGKRGADIDHLVIGPGGVFTVNAKHHPKAEIWVGGDTFMVNGSRQPYIRNSRHEAARASKLLTTACGHPVQVEGLIVTVNADDVTIKNAPDGVHVVPRMQVAKWLLRHGDILELNTIDAVYGAARRSTTWRP